MDEDLRTTFLIHLQSMDTELKQDYTKHICLSINFIIHWLHPYATLSLYIKLLLWTGTAANDYIQSDPVGYLFCLTKSKTQIYSVYNPNIQTEQSSKYSNLRGWIKIMFFVDK